MQTENQVLTSLDIREESYPLGDYRCLAAIAETLHVHRTTLFRWRQHGHKGVKLHALKTPKGWMTTLKAVQHFLERLTSLEHPEEPILTPAREDRRQVRVETELARRFGVGPKGKEVGND
jgi:Protein of unknown function (DUF1580)